MSIDVLALVLPQSLPPRSPSYDSSVWLRFANFDSHKSSAGWESGVSGSDVVAVRSGERNDGWIGENDGKSAARVADCISDWYFEVNFDEN